MTTSDYGGSTSDEGAGAKERAQHAAGTAAEEGRQVAGVARDEARQVTSEARHQAQDLMSEARTQLSDQSRSQRDRVVDSLRTFSDDLEQMSSQRDGGMATDFVHQVATRARRLSDNMEGREPTELLDDVRTFARRQPGTFLLGAFVAGIVAGRLARGAKQAEGPSTGESEAPTYERTQGMPSGPPEQRTAPPGDPSAGTSGVYDPGRRDMP